MALRVLGLAGCVPANLRGSFFQCIELCVQTALFFDLLKHAVTKLKKDLVYLDVHTGDRVLSLW